LAAMNSRTSLFTASLISGCTIGGALQGYAFEFTNYSAGTSAPLNGVVAGANVFVAVSTSSQVFKSQAGSLRLGWQAVSVPVSSLELRSATYGAGLFVVGGQNSMAFKSADGANWSQVANVFPGSPKVLSLAFNDSTFVGVNQGFQISWADTNLTLWHVLNQ